MTEAATTVFGILGPLEVRGAAGPVAISAARQRAVLALLLLHHNRLVSTAEIIEAVWPDPPPPTVRDQVPTVISGLRRLLGDDHRVLVTRHPGYLLSLGTDQLDLTRFETLTRAAEAAGRPQPAVAALREALRLWRGPALADISAPFAGPAARSLGELRSAAAQRLVDLELSLGRHRDLVPELDRMVREFPLNEHLRGRLMLALYRSGDVHGALEAYRAARRASSDRLGLEPGRELSELHRLILRRDPSLATAPGSTWERARPGQLPRRPPLMVGRDEHVRIITDALRGSDHTPVIALHGPGGVGKSAIALHVAHAVADSYPDGQLYADLQDGGRPLAASDVLARFLRALGTPAAAVPTAAAEAAADYRSKLRDRRVLVVLDNATTAAQIAPLLPTHAGCAALITSRSLLPTLDARSVEVDLLDEPDSVRLLALLAGEARIAGEPAAARQIARLCGRLPLALRIAGARLAARADLALADLAYRLRDERHRLDELHIDDLAVRPCFEVGYAGLGQPVAALAFRCLGALNTPTFSVGLTAALLDVPGPRAEAALDGLVRAHLVEPLGPGRYRMHDLLRIYAAELADEALDDAVRRGLDWYLDAARQVGDIVQSRSWDLERAERPVLGRLEAAEAMAWIDAEFPNLTAAAVRFTESTFAIELMPLVKRLAQKRGHWAELESISRAALSIARQRGDRPAEAAALATIASVDWRAGHDELAFREANAALELWREIGDRGFEALARHNVGWLRWQIGDLEGALTDMREAARMLRGSDRFKPAMVWHNLNEVLLQLGRHREAAAGFRRTLAVRRSDGDPFGESITLLGLARAYIMLGDYDGAIATLDESVEACRRVGNSEDEWHAMLCRSEVRLRRGEVALAVRDAHLTRDLLRHVGQRYSQAATARQLARVYEAAGRHAEAADQADLAATLFAAVTRRVPDVEAIFNAGGEERHPR